MLRPAASARRRQSPLLLRIWTAPSACLRERGLDDLVELRHHLVLRPAFPVVPAQDGAVAVDAAERAAGLRQAGIQRLERGSIRVAIVACGRGKRPREAVPAHVVPGVELRPALLVQQIPRYE